MLTTVMGQSVWCGEEGGVMHLESSTIWSTEARTAGSDRSTKARILYDQDSVEFGQYSDV